MQVLFLIDLVHTCEPLYLLHFRYSNIFVTAPSPENLKTMFEFVFKGFDALEYQYDKSVQITECFSVKSKQKFSVAPNFFLNTVSCKCRERYHFLWR